MDFAYYSGGLPAQETERSRLDGCSMLYNTVVSRSSTWEYTRAIDNTKQDVEQRDEFPTSTKIEDHLERNGDVTNNNRTYQNPTVT